VSGRKLNTTSPSALVSAVPTVTVALLFPSLVTLKVMVAVCARSKVLLSRSYTLTLSRAALRRVLLLLLPADRFTITLSVCIVNVSSFV